MLLLFAALERSIENEGKDFGDIDAPSLRDLVRKKNSKRHDEFRIRLSDDDQKVFADLINQIDSQKNGETPKIVENFNLFTKKIQELSEEEAKDFSKGLAGLQVVGITLSHTDDDPQYIFESMNSKGKPLSVSDLARNYMLMKLDSEEQEVLYKRYWLQMEDNLRCEENDYTELFLRDYLIAKIGEGVGKETKRIYEKFKEHYNKFKEHYNEGGLAAEKFLQELLKYSDFYSRLACPGKESNDKLSLAFNDWRGFSMAAQMPLMLALYASFADKCFSDQEFVRIVRMIESYVFRRWACNLPPNSRNMLFLSLIKQINSKEFADNSYFASIAQCLRAHGEDSKKRFPGDDEFASLLIGIDIYGDRQGSCRYVLRKLENSDPRERRDLDKLTIEHVMPQSLTSKWRKELGKNHEDVYSRFLHKLGNLTLTGHDPELSNKPFLEKRDYPGGYKESRLWLNDYVGEQEKWTQEEIEARGKILAARAVEMWPLPEVK